ncbi:MAG: DUF2608 domain-containing protein [Alphaproteobacteria bacterium]
MTFLQNRKIFKIVFLLVLLTACKEEKSIMSVYSIHEVQAKVDELLKKQRAEDILVVFDVDMTLTQPDHAATYYPAIKKFKSIIKNIFEPLTPAQRDIALTLTTKLPQKLIEKDSPTIIRAMQDKGINVIALTATLTGSWKDSKNKIVFKRKDTLQKLGFNFSFQGRVVPYMNFPKYADGYPMLYHGVLCSNGENNEIGKGKTLSVFLRQVGMTKGAPYGSGYVPKVVIMVDDREKNFVDIQKTLAVDFPAIQFIGIKYDGALGYAPQDISEKDFEEFWQEMADKAKRDCPL